MLYSDNDKKRIQNIVSAKGLEGEEYRTAWRRDFARLIHSPSFRRLQGKTQLFPGIESDFFRNRLTHSLEVAQVAKSIAIRLNNTCDFFKREGFQIEPDLVEFAGLAHDLGHPPFGHNGEKALDDCMKEHGGFEGNAQTLRILAKIEKRDKAEDSSVYGIKDEQDCRYGLNLTMRSLAAILKYDKKIPYKRSSKDRVQKGYYTSEEELVKTIKESVLNGQKIGKTKFKTVECHIMDIADDIAYSTYDLEDAFKANFLTPFDLLTSDGPIYEEVAARVTEKLGHNISRQDVRVTLQSAFEGMFSETVDLSREQLDLENTSSILPFIFSTYTASKSVAQDGYNRSDFSSSFIGQCIRNVKIKENKELPFLTEVTLDPEVLQMVEVVKNFTYVSIIGSSRLKIPEYRGHDIVKYLFETLSRDDGIDLLPLDYREICRTIKSEEKDRIICDFISGMTDRYVLEFYGRLRSENPQTIFKPL